MHRFSNTRVYVDKKLNETTRGKHKYAFRSKSELAYAKELDILKKSGKIKCWEYEPDSFEFTVKMKYTPDWKITDLDNTEYYVETKGYLSPKDRKKLKDFANNSVCGRAVYLKFYNKNHGPLENMISVEDFFKRKKSLKKCST